MIEGLILLTELALFALLLLAVKRSSQPGAPQDLGLFAFKDEPDKKIAPAGLKQKQARRGGGDA